MVVVCVGALIYYMFYLFLAGSDNAYVYYYERTCMSTINYQLRLGVGISYTTVNTKRKNEPTDPNPTGKEDRRQWA